MQRLSAVSIANAFEAKIFSNRLHTIALLRKVLNLYVENVYVYVRKFIDELKVSGRFRHFPQIQLNERKAIQLFVFGERVLIK